ncbi:MAG TPA: endolytic transglycosylase MltG [Pyrinomonadaceae bacterium]|nr:endolytic transglycosylase MltG [Pyrinomonadaceae bacterium]
MKLILTAVIILLFASGTGLGLWIFSDLHKPVSHAESGQYIEIPKGSSSASVIRRLAAEGIIKHQWPLTIYLKITGRGSNFKAGEYDFPSPISPLAAVAKLERGESRLTRLTVVEGWTRWDIAEAMSRILELHLENAKSALPLMENVELIRDIDPSAQNLEGYLYPDTYEFSAERTSPAQLIELMVKRFRHVWLPEWSQRAALLNMTPRQIVTTASLIETEAKLATERPIIASVVYNRLKLDMPLAIDSTVIYASKLEGKWHDDGKVYKSDIERRSPYNTRLYVGLPPGPVASPGESSLLAAINPSQSDYLYYVREPSRDDGAHNFYNNSRDFESGVLALRKWERERDLEKARRKAEANNASR